MLPIGLIGAGTEWEAVWRPAFAQLSRLVVSSFYDPVAVRSERVAEAHDWPEASGVRQLLQNPRLRGLVILDAGWHGNWPIHEADARHLPVFVSAHDSSLDSLASALQAATGETLIQPDLRRRYTAATMRVRELTATRLGPVSSLRVEIIARQPPSLSRWAEAIDWCRYIVQSAVLSARQAPSGTALHVTFRKSHQNIPVEAQIVWCETAEPPEYPTDFASELICRNGVAIIHGARRVRWKSGDQEGDETLADDRTSAAVQLDLFARRLAGGLVPVASLEDIATAVDAAKPLLIPDS